MARVFGPITSKQKMSFDKSFSRINGQPLDATEIFYSYQDAVTYAQSNTAYVGQKVVVVDTTNETVTHYSIELDSSLKGIGVVTLGDGYSIELSDQSILMLHDWKKFYYQHTSEVQPDGTHYIKVSGFKAGLVPRVIAAQQPNEYELAWFEPEISTQEILDEINQLSTDVENLQIQYTELVNGTIADIQADIQDLYDTKVDTVQATENNILIADGNGGLKNSEKTIGGATLSADPDANTAATEVAVQTAINAAKLVWEQF